MQTARPPRPAFLPNGRGVVAATPQRSYLIDLNGNARPVAPAGVVGWAPTPGGKFVLATNAAHQWALHPLAGGAAVPEPNIAASDSPPRFASGPGTLYVMRRTSFAAANIFPLNLRTGQRTLAHTLATPDATGGGISNVSISRDGKTYAFTYASMRSTLNILSGLRER